MSQYWQNISDDDLDDLFRKAAETENVAFEADSWAKMNQKLDAMPFAEQKEDRFRKALPLLLLLLLLSFVGGYFFVNRSSASTSTKVEHQVNSVSGDVSNSENLSKSKIQSASTGKQTTQQTNEKGIQITDNNNSGVDSEKEPKATLKTESNTNISNNRTENYRREQPAKDIGSFSKRSFARSTKQKTDISNTEKQSYKNVIVASETTDKPAYAKTSKKYSSNSVQNQPFNTETTSTTDVQVNSVIEPTGIEENLVSKTNLSNLNELASKKPSFRSNWPLPFVNYQAERQSQSVSSPSLSFKKGLNFRLSVSPDISTVAFNEIRKVGTNIGVLVEYRYNNRWSIQTGLIRSLKIYEAYPEQYTWIWKMPNTPLLDINATCKMYDIPLNIRYDITQKAKTRWFVSGGVTTYRMLEETYLYNYENNNDPSIKWKKWVGSTGSYPFKVINISSGYEKEFRRNLTFQIEPFVKIPTAKIGFGKVNLSTIGVFLSAKYHIGK